MVFKDFVYDIYNFGISSSPALQSAKLMGIPTWKIFLGQSQARGLVPFVDPSLFLTAAMRSQHATKGRGMLEISLQELSFILSIHKA